MKQVCIVIVVLLLALQGATAVPLKHYLFPTPPPPQPPASVTSGPGFGVPQVIKRFYEFTDAVNRLDVNEAMALFDPSAYGQLSFLGPQYLSYTQLKKELTEFCVAANATFAFPGRFIAASEHEGLFLQESATVWNTNTANIWGEFNKGVTFLALNPANGKIIYFGKFSDLKQANHTAMVKIVHEFIQAIQNKDISVLLTSTTSNFDFTVQTVGNEAQNFNQSAFIALMKGQFEARTQFMVKVHEIFAAGIWVCAHYTVMLQLDGNNIVGDALGRWTLTSDFKLSQFYEMWDSPQ